MRLAGTWKQYSAKAMSHEMTMTLNSGAWRYFRWPYQAKVMKMLERVRSRIVVIRICCLIRGFDCTPSRSSGATGVSPVHVGWRQYGGGAGAPGSPPSRASGFRDRLANRFQHSIHLSGRPNGDPNTSVAAGVGR